MAKSLNTKQIVDATAALGDAPEFQYGLTSKFLHNPEAMKLAEVAAKNGNESQMIRAYTKAIENKLPESDIQKIKAVAAAMEVKI